MSHSYKSGSRHSFPGGRIPFFVFSILIHLIIFYLITVTPVSLPRENPGLNRDKEVAEFWKNGAKQIPDKTTDPQTGTLKGITRIKGKGGLGGVEIRAIQSQTGKVSQTLSDEMGAYEFKDLEPGSYSLNAVLQGYRVFNQDNIQVTGKEETLVVNIQLFDLNLPFRIHIFHPSYKGQIFFFQESLNFRYAISMSLNSTLEFRRLTSDRTFSEVMYLVIFSYQVFEWFSAKLELVFYYCVRH